jgi:hypothetical protein
MAKAQPVVEKTSDFEIKVTKQEPTPEPTVTKYELDFLYSQQKAIQKSLDAFTEARQAELDEVAALIEAAEGLGVTKKPEQTTNEVAVEEKVKP